MALMGQSRVACAGFVVVPETHRHHGSDDLPGHDDGPTLHPRRALGDPNVLPYQFATKVVDHVREWQCDLSDQATHVRGFRC